MVWKYTPAPIKDETYWFNGPFYTDKEIARQINPDDMTKAFRAVIEASLAQGGLDKIQELEHETTKTAIKIINILSQEQKHEIRQKSPNPEEEIQERNGTIALMHRKR